MPEPPDDGDPLNHLRSLLDDAHYQILLTHAESSLESWKYTQSSPDEIADLNLTHLLEYGYTLLDAAITVRETNSEHYLVTMAFEVAGRSIATATSLHAHNSSTLDKLVASASFQIAGFGARSYTLLTPILEDPTATIVEQALIHLIRRDLRATLTLCRTFRQSSSTSIRAIETRVSQSSSDHGQTTPSAATSLVDLVDDAITNRILGALATAIMGLEEFEYDYIVRSARTLRLCRSQSAKFNLPNNWWSARLAELLVTELWRTSLQRLTVEAPLHNNPRWQNLLMQYTQHQLRHRNAKIDLWPSQLEAAWRVSTSSTPLVISLPTGAGKTRIAELAAIRCLSSGRSVIYVAPLRALCSQIESRFQAAFIPLGFTVSSSYMHGRSDSLDANRTSTPDIDVMTPERLDAIERLSPELLDPCGLIIFDEGHSLGPNFRGILYETTIDRLHARTDSQERQILCLSALLPGGRQLEDFAAWMTDGSAGAEGDPPVISSPWKPTGINFADLTFDFQTSIGTLTLAGDDRSAPPSQPFIDMGSQGSKYKFPRQSSGPSDLTLMTALEFIRRGKNVLIFCPERRSVEKVSRRLSELLARGFFANNLNSSETPSSWDRVITRARSELGAENPIVSCLSAGVLVHHGALPIGLRRELEAVMDSPEIKLVIASPTLTQGLNLAVSVVVFHSLYRAGKPISDTEFANVVGRVGRAYVDERGLAVLPHAATKPVSDAWKSLVVGRQMFDVRSGVLRLILAAMQSFFEETGRGPEDWLEYIAGNTSLAAPLFQSTEIELETLDRALLQLTTAYDDSFRTSDEVLTEALQHSLLIRSIETASETNRSHVMATIRTRARYLWSKSSLGKRKIWRHLGLGLAGTTQLEKLYPSSWATLMECNRAILAGDEVRAAELLKELVASITSIPSFRPESKPDVFAAVLDAWIQPHDTSRNQQWNGAMWACLESDIKFRTLNGLHAILERHSIGEDDDVEDPEPIWPVRALEFGSVSLLSLRLMDEGFDSRLGAQAVADRISPFPRSLSIEDWLMSDTVIALQLDPSWPSPDTHELWREFVAPAPEQISPGLEGPTVRRRFPAILFEDAETLDPGTAVRARSEAGTHTFIESEDCTLVGMISRFSLPKDVVARAHIFPDTSEVELEFSGANSATLTALSQ